MNGDSADRGCKRQELSPQYFLSMNEQETWEYRGVFRLFLDDDNVPDYFRDMFLRFLVLWSFFGDYSPESSDMFLIKMACWQFEEVDLLLMIDGGASPRLQHIL